MFDESFFDQLRALPTRKLIRKTIHDGLLSFASYATVLRIDAARLEKYMDGDDNAITYQDAAQLSDFSLGLWGCIKVISPDEMIRGRLDTLVEEYGLSEAQIGAWIGATEQKVRQLHTSEHGGPVDYAIATRLMALNSFIYDWARDTHSQQQTD